MHLSLSGLLPFMRCLLMLSVFAALPTLAHASDGNLLKDAGFEEKLPGGQGGWTIWDRGEISADQARSGQHSMFNWGFSRTVLTPPYLVGTAHGSYQQVAAAPGSRWRMTGYALTPSAVRGTALGIIQVSFFDAEGNDLGTEETLKVKGPKAKGSNQVNSKSPVGEWIFLDTGVATAPANTAAIHAFTIFVDYSGSEVAQGVYFDDLKLCSLAEGDDGADCR